MEIPHKIGHIIANRYEVTDTLGRGGIATTYAAKDLTANQPVALKELSLRRMGEFKVLELFEREARTLKQLHHPAIPSYLDYFCIDTAEDRAFYIVQQLAEGKSLAELVRGWRTNEIGVRQIAAKVLNILIYLQAQKPSIVHRDIKPQNLILREDGQIFLVDFGAVQDTYRTTVARGSTVVGTYGYMAPEQFRGEAVPATDLYGLGTTLLFLLTHRCPSELPQERLRYSFRDRIQVSDQFADWLQQMVEPDEEDRFSSAKEALAALQGKRIRSRARSPIPLKTAVGLGVAIVVALNTPKYLKAPWISLTARYHPSPEEAASIGDVDMLSSILFWRGLFMDRESKVWWTSYIFRYAKSAEVVELLIARGAEPNLRDDQNKTPLHNAIELPIYYPYDPPSREMVEALVAGGANINAGDNYGYTPLHILVKSVSTYKEKITKNEFEEMIAQTWVANGADINAQDRYGRTPLHWAVSPWAMASNNGDPSILAEWMAAALIANGADVNARDRHGRTPLHATVEYFPGADNKRVINTLITHGAQINAEDNDGRTPLHLVVAGGNIKENSDGFSSGDSSPFSSVNGLNAGKGEDEIEIESSTCSKMPPWSVEHHDIWWTSRVQLASLLLSHGATNTKDDLDLTPLQLAASICDSRTTLSRPQTELVELLDYGAKDGSGN
ncbi:ankyrin repeat domain-containing protein [Leptolyngbya sp. FACHB-541]|uniref:protein kinase domain-containing protein n=1 Tax=Leptolyngbya sp. FACHB-541 TaxID=2692810 RepID=UPI00168880A7|nr:ankyrin repeat domain-containing protein [Leptolyngbya sp. FACHB-541]MBD1999980.1 ankyrin repeat domain-containing protein [Leptolyngbya sp. FACHB-541]